MDFAAQFSGPVDFLIVLAPPDSYPQLRTSRTLFIGSGSVPVE